MKEGDPDETCLEWDQIWKDRHAKLAKLDFDWDPPKGTAATKDWSTLSFVTLTCGRSKPQLCDYLEAKVSVFVVYVKNTRSTCVLTTFTNTIRARQ